MFDQVVRDYFVTGKETQEFLQKKQEIISCSEMEKLETLREDIYAWITKIVDEKDNGSLLTKRALFWAVVSGATTAQTTMSYGWSLAKTSISTLTVAASCCFFAKSTAHSERMLPKLELVAKMNVNIQAFFKIIDDRVFILQKEQNNIISRQTSNDFENEPVNRRRISL